MADTNPYANAGVGMMGQDVAMARQMSTPESFTEKMQKAGGAAANPLAILAYAAANKMADMFGSDGGAGGGGNWSQGNSTGAQVFRAIVPPGPQGGGAPMGVAPTAPSAPAVGQSSTGGTGSYRDFLRLPSLGGGQ